MVRTAENNGWFLCKHTSTPPAPRYKHTAVLHENSMIIFAGRQKDPQKRNFNDIFAYNFSTGEWYQIHPKNQQDAPSPRAGHTSVVIQSSMFIFGGHSGVYCNDLYEFQFKTHTWNRLDVVDNVPGARYYHSAIMFNDNMYIFGGYGYVNNYGYGAASTMKGSCCGDLHEFDFKTRSWKQIAYSENSPKRYGHSAAVYLNSMFIFAGRDKYFRRCRDLYEFNFETHHWRKINDSGVLPSRRSFHTAAVIGNSLFIFGGTDSQLCNKLFRFDFVREKWELVNVKGTIPPGRMSHTLVAHRNDLVLFGGFGGSTGTFLNDLYIYKVGENIPKLFTKKYLKYGHFNDVLFSLYS